MSKPSKFSRAVAALLLLVGVLLAPPALAQFAQQGIDLAAAGWSVSLSADGNTALLGDPQFNSAAGAARVFVRDNGVWNKQGADLVPSDGSGALAKFGSAVAMSADGTTAVIGAPNDNGNIGAVWVFKFDNTNWVQVGNKQTPIAPTGNPPKFGSSVAVSSNGATLLVGGPDDGNPFQTGAVWAFHFDGASLTQIGGKLTVADLFAGFGSSVALSSDGNTALIAGVAQNSFAGAAWVFTFNGTIYSQVGNMLTPSDADDSNGSQIRFGSSVALSSDGNTALIGGWGDNSAAGAAWVFNQSGNAWTQQGNKLTPTGVGSNANIQFGWSVALSADGDTAVIGGPSDANVNLTTGSAWVFVRNFGSTFSQQDSKLTGTNFESSIGFSAAMSADGNTALIGTTNEALAFVQTPAITNVDLNGGSSLGGDTVTIHGTGFGGIDNGSVKFDGVAATDVVVIDPHTVTLTTPAHAAGTVDVDVTNAIGNVTGIGAFVYIDPPVVTSLGPNRGPISGGTTVTINGSNFATVESVSFGGIAASQIFVDSDTQVRAVTPAHSAGAVNVLVHSVGGNKTVNFGYIYINPPVVTAVSPNSGPIGGGTAVTITGTDLTGATAVTIGGSAATNVSVVNATIITATVPAHASGAVTVSVTTVGGTGSKASAFTYAALPTVTSVSPTSGPIAGNTAVTIHGTNFTGASAVKFGGTAATNVNVVNATTVTAKTPAHAAGAVTVEVTTPGGTGSKASAFTYYGVPTITAINPNQGPAKGGTAVAIVGTNLTGATAVKFGPTASSSFSVQNATHATATAPAHIAGAVNVTLTTPGGTSAATNGNKFTYTKTPVMTTIAKFVGGKNDGSKPVGGLVPDSAGALYGTTSQGGKDGLGTIFKLTPSGSSFTKTILYQFDGLTGATPFAGLVIDSSKNLYGVTTAGGNKNKGVLFKYTASTKKVTVLHNFQGTAADGGVPYATLARDSGGMLYGATTEGGSKGKGTTFTFKEPSTFKVTHHFTGGSDGANAQGAILLDANKNAYGTTIEGGNPKQGVAYKIAPNGTRTILHTFAAASTDGHQPRSGLFIKGTTVIGTTYSGGTQNKGTIFKLNLPSTADTLLFSFTGTTGANPYAGVVGDAATILYGTTFNGGAKNLGTVFELLPPANNQTAWSQSVMASFKGGANEGASPAAPVLLGKNKTLYGTTNGGGSSACAGGCGTVFKVTY